MDKKSTAQYLGVGIRTLENWSDQVPKYRPGGKVLFKKSEIDEFMARHREKSPGVDLDRIADEAIKAILR